MGVAPRESSLVLEGEETDAEIEGGELYVFFGLD